MLYDKQLSVNRNEACAFCHMPRWAFTVRVGAEPDHRLLSWVSAHAGSATASRNRTPMRRLHLCCTIIQDRETSSAAISGTCVRPPPLGNPAPSRRKGRRPTRWKWATRYRLCRSIAPRSGPTGHVESVWGMQAFAIAWPGVVDRSAPARRTIRGEPMPVHFSSLRSSGWRHVDQ